MSRRMILFIISFSFLVGISCTKNEPASVRIQIIETTDLHGSIFSYNFIDGNKHESSLAALTGYLDSVKRQKNTELILLDNGDILQGQPPVYYDNYIDTTGEHIASQVLNFIGYDAATVGNHDIEPGHAVYDKIKEEYNFPWLAANAIDNKTGDPYFQPYTIIKRKGVKVAVLGLITPAIPNWLPEKVYEGMRFEDMVPSAEKWIKKIKAEEKPDLMVGLFHSGLGESDETKMKENAVFDIAMKVTGFDIIFYGHDHHPNISRVENHHGKKVLLMNPGANAEKAALAEVIMGKEKDKFVLNDIQAKFIELSSYSITDDFQNEFKPFIEEVKNYVREEIAYLPETIFAGDALFGPSKWMQLIHEVQMKYTNADLSFSAPLSLYSEMEKGPLSTGDLFKFYRYRNLLYTIKLKGQEIDDYLEYSYANWYNTLQSPEGHLLKFKLDSNKEPLYSKSYGHYVLDGTYYNFDSGYGIDYTVDVTKPKGNRVNISSFSDGKPFKSDKFYNVAINSYRANGGGGHLTKGIGLEKSEIKERIMDSRNNDIRYLILEELSNRDTIRININKNWQVQPVSWWKETKTRDSLLLFNSKH